MNTLVRGLLRFLSILPRPVLQWLGSITGRMHRLFRTRSARVTEVNLALCLPGQEHQLLLPSLVETAKSVFETPAIWLGDLDQIDRWIVSVQGENLLKEALQDSRGLLLLLPHIGNWELFNVFFRRYGRMTALYQPPRLEYMQSLMAEVRARHGNRMVPTTPAGLKQLYRALGNGETVVILPDQVPASGEFAPFFGHAALTDQLTSRLLARSDAIVLGISMIRRSDGRFDVHVQPPPDGIATPGKATTAVNQLIEQAVSLAPAQYQWEYKRFRERPPGEKKLYRFDRSPGFH